MLPSEQSRRLWSILLVSLVVILGGSNALIVSPRPATKQQGLGRRNPADADGYAATQQEVSVARIRSTRRSDVEPISELLSSAIGGGGDNINQNWKARIERLRVKSSVRSTLDLRVRAIQEGKKYLTKQIRTTEGDLTLEVNDPDHLRYLWSRDSFRNKVAQAAELSSEPHPWDGHNFALAPEDPRWLRHEMITAEDVETGEIVGFCEVAMLLCPPVDDTLNFAMNRIDDEAEELCSVDCAPTIANLVVAPAWRRRGVAKGLVKSAERFVARKWKCDELGLYVEKRNQRALNLYISVGYNVKSSISEPEEPEKWYMSKDLTVR